MKVVAALLAIAFVFSPVVTWALTPLPWSSYSDAVIDVMFPAPIGCPEGSVSGAILRGNWHVASTDTKDVFVHLDEAGKPDAVYFTRGTEAENRIEVVRSQETVTPAEVCSYLFSDEATLRTSLGRSVAPGGDG